MDTAWGTRKFPATTSGRSEAILADGPTTLALAAVSSAVLDSTDQPLVLTLDATLVPNWTVAASLVVTIASLGDGVETIFGIAWTAAPAAEGAVTIVAKTYFWAGVTVLVAAAEQISGIFVCVAIGASAVHGL